MTQSSSQNQGVTDGKDATHAAYMLKGNLREGSITRHLTRLTVPMIWGIAAIISFQLVDIYFIGKLGTEALASITFTFPFTYAFLTLMISAGIAMSSVFSRLIGAKGDKETRSRTVMHGMMFTLVLTLILTVMGYVLVDPIFKLMGANEAQLGMIHEYLDVWFFSVPFLIVPMVGNSALRAAGDAVWPAIIMTLIAIINIVLDPFFIFGLYGFPEMGIAGAAMATVIANAVAFFVGLYIYIVKRELTSLCWIFKVKHIMETIKSMAVIIVPVSITQLIQPIVNAVIIALLANYGSEAVAGMGVASRVEAFSFIVLMALSTGLSPIVGQNFGARLFDRVKETMRKAIWFACLWSFAIAIILLFAGQFIAGLFSSEPEVIRVAYLYFMIVPISYAFANLVTGWSSAFNAMGMPKRSLVMLVVKMIVLLIPSVYVGSHFGIWGIFLAIACVNIIAGAFFHYNSKFFLIQYASENGQ